MSSITEFLKGKKTYIIAGLMLAYQLIGHYVYGNPIDFQTILAALGLGTLRGAVGAPKQQ